MQGQLTPSFGDYELIDTGDFEKLERFGQYVTRRPEPQAIWRRSLPEGEWRPHGRRGPSCATCAATNAANGACAPGMPPRWTVAYEYKDMALRMRLGLTSFKHVGIFPEQAANWNFIYDNCRALASGGTFPADISGAAAAGSHLPAHDVAVPSGAGSGRDGHSATGPGRCVTPRVLNLFAYTGGASLAACAAGADTTHVDSVKQVVTWARENMELSGLDGIRWIVEDALKFVQREVRRGNRYHGIILDPPAYGAGCQRARNGFSRTTSARCSSAVPGCWSRRERSSC